VLLVTGFTLVGEGINDVLNPLIRQRRIAAPPMPDDGEPPLSATAAVGAPDTGQVRRE
jgi:hypothetical protein